MSTQLENSEQLVKVLIKRRKDIGMSQIELSKLCDLSINGISKFESSAGAREVKLSTLFKLGKVLGFKINLEFEE